MPALEFLLGSFFRLCILPYTVAFDITAWCIGYILICHSNAELVLKVHAWDAEAAESENSMCASHGLVRACQTAGLERHSTDSLNSVIVCVAW
jgi:hypothetical protein